MGGRSRRRSIKEEQRGEAAGSAPARGRVADPSPRTVLPRAPPGSASAGSPPACARAPMYIPPTCSEQAVDPNRSEHPRLFGPDQRGAEANRSDGLIRFRQKEENMIDGGGGHVTSKQ